MQGEKVFEIVVARGRSLALNVQMSHCPNCHCVRLLKIGLIFSLWKYAETTPELFCAKSREKLPLVCGAVFPLYHQIQEDRASRSSAVTAWKLKFVVTIRLENKPTFCVLFKYLSLLLFWTCGKLHLRNIKMGPCQVSEVSRWIRTCAFQHEVGFKSQPSTGEDVCLPCQN